MKILISMDEHYLRETNGAIYSSEGTTPYTFWKRFLQVFSTVTILARVKDEVDPRKLRPEARANGADVDFYPLPDFRGPLGYLQNRRKIIKTASEVAKEGDAFLLHGIGLVSGTVADVLYRKRLPYALQVIGDPKEVHGMGGVGGPLRLPLRWYAPWKLALICRRAVAVSYVTRRTLQDRYPVSPNAFQTGFSDVQVGGALLDEGQLAKRIHSLEKIGERNPKLGFIGSLEQPYKGADVLLRALARCARHGVVLACDLVGDGKLRGQYESLAIRLGLRNSVRFLGRLPAGDAIFSFLDSVDIFVMPSLTEGLPRAMIEAMARGCPAIGSRVGGIPELLGEECLFPAGDHRQLAEMLLSKLNSAELCRMAKTNREEAGRYAPELMAEKRMEFLTEIQVRTTLCKRKFN